MASAAASTATPKTSAAFSQDESDLEPELSPRQQRRLDGYVQACLTGDGAGAEIGLSQWNDEPDCPSAARVLYASLLARRGEVHHARQVLGHLNMRTITSADEHEIKLIVSLLISDELYDTARQMAEILRDKSTLSVGMTQWLSAMGLLSNAIKDDPLAVITDEDTRRLMQRLFDDPSLIESLGYAATSNPDAVEALLLQRALASLTGNYLFFDFADKEQVTTLTVLAELSLAMSQMEEAIYWAEQGLELDPFSAKLAMVLFKAGAGPERCDVLLQVSAKYPQYPDVRSALIQSEFQAGHQDEARRRLHDWLDVEPNAPLALQLQSRYAGLNENDSGQEEVAA